MKKSRRARRPMLRTRRTFGDHGTGSATGRLASMAGGARPSVDQLEPRQLLFSLTISPSDDPDGNGIGSVTAFFGYFAPVLYSSAQPQLQPPIVTDENFDDEFPLVAGQALPLVQNLPNNQLLLQSNVRVRHNITPASNLQIVAGAPPDEVSDRYVRARLDNGQYVAFRQEGNATTGQAIGMQQMSFQIDRDTGAQGLNAANMAIQLFYQGQQVGNFTGQALLNLAGGNANGTGRFVVNTPAGVAAFDELRIVAFAGPNDGFRLDDLQTLVSPGVFAPLIEARKSGAEIRFAGPVGASIQFFDLYGRDMIQTIDIGVPPGLTVALFDINDDGIPDGNDGIGRIVISGADKSTALTMFGGTIRPLAPGTPPDPDDDFVEGSSVFRRIENLNGLYDDFESTKNFGYNAFLPPGQPEVQITGLPPGAGSLIIGSPWVRPLNNYRPQGLPADLNYFNGDYGNDDLVFTDNNGAITGWRGNVWVRNHFIRPEQGIFVNGSSMASVYIHGVLHGSSSFPGSLDRLVVSQLLGSVTVAGDLGALVVGGDAGIWSDDDNTPGAIKTNAQLVVGRSVGEIDIGGRSVLDVTVVGDVNAPGTRPARDVANYYEKEFIYGINPGAPNEPETVILRTLDSTDYATDPAARRFRLSDQGLLFGNVFRRNDSIMGAEYIGSMGTGVRVSGDLSGQDPIQGEDNVDVYAFANDGRTPITLQVDGGIYFRLVDQDGRTVAAPQFVRGIGTESFITYTPDSPGVYYVVLTDPAGAGDTASGFASYTLTVLGMAPTMLGALRTGASMGITTGGNLTASVNVLSGNVGSIRIGTGVNSAGGGDSTPSVVVNTGQDDDALLTWYEGTISVPGTLYNITTGSDIQGSLTGAFGPITIAVGRDLASMVTGLSPVAGLGPTEGDVVGMRLNVGGRIGTIDVRGGIGMDQDATDPLAVAGVPGSFQVLSGRSGGNGDIGMIRVGSHAPGDTLRVDTSPGSTVGAILVSQDIDLTDGARQGLYFGDRGVQLNVGLGSDIRFVDFPRIDGGVLVNVTTPLIVGEVREFTDDGGGRVRIRVIGTNTGANVGNVRVLRVDGSQGVAIGQIVVDLSGGAALEIESVGTTNPNDIIAIGKIIVTAATGAAGITVKGVNQIDVWKVESAAALSFIRNETPGGDFVAIDTQGLTTLEIQHGDLGRTQVPAWGPQLIGPFMGIGGAAGGTGRVTPLAVGGAGAGINGLWTGQTYRPVGNAVNDGSFHALDDIGSPFDPYLNGLVVRAGSLDTVRVSGAVGDVIVQAGNLVRVDANSDRVTATGRFDGIVGTLFGQNISRVDIGDGLAQRAHAPLATTGIFAVNDIIQILNENSTVASISSTVLAANQTAGDANQFDGIDTLDLKGGGDFRDAWIGADWLDGFWTSAFTDDDAVYFGNINVIRGVDADLFRCEVSANDINTVELRNGFYDATFMRVGSNLTSITTAGYRNSTLVGGDLEFRVSSIVVSRDLTTLTTFQKTGDIVDLIVDVSGRVITEISGRDMVRVQYEVANALQLLDIRGSLRSSIVNAGLLPSVKAAGSILSSRISSSGEITSLTAGGNILNTDIEMSGPGGNIKKITAAGSITGSISSAGPIDEVTATAGDIRARIKTTSDRGSVNTLTAGRDLDIDTDISGSVSKLVAGRHIGSLSNPRVIVIRSSLTSATAGGQLYADLRVGQNITDKITIGAVSALPGNNLVGSGSIIAFGSINAVVVNGDFGGDIISYTGGIRTVSITNGSFYPNRRIAAYDGSIDSLVITNGNLYGNVHADYVLFNIQVIGDAAGVFGDIGINPYRSAATAYDGLRNQAPVGVAVTSRYDGSTITAGWYLVNLSVTNGSIWESKIIAGRAIGTIDVRGGLNFDANGNVIDLGGSILNDQLTDGFGSIIGAADSINVVSIALDMSETIVIGGLVDLGADGRAGGKGLNKDSLKFGRVDGVYVGGSMYDSIVNAGIMAGADGSYRTVDDRVAAGPSYVNALVVAGNVGNAWVLGDAIGLQIKADTRLGSVGDVTQLEDSEVDDGTATGVNIPSTGLFIDLGEEEFVAYYSGPGQGIYDAVGRRIVLMNSTVATSFTLVQTKGDTLTNFDIVTNDDASVGVLDIRSILAGDSDIVVDGHVNDLRTGAWIGTGSLKIGGDVTSWLSGDFVSGTVRINYISNMFISGQIGAANGAVRGEVKFDMVGAGSITVLTKVMGAINVSRDLFQFTAGGAFDSGSLRVGGSLTSFVAGSMSRSWVSARDAFNAVQVSGNVFDSSIMAGADLGDDAEFGGVGLAADTVTSGFMGNVTIQGNFYESDIAAGVLRGADGFFGTGDDNFANGRSTIGNVKISGTGVGSNRGSESYRIISTGSIGAVTLAGEPALDQGNFKVETRVLQALPFNVSDLNVTQDSGVYTARIVFNQPVDSSTINSALGVYEVRGSNGEVEIKLISGTDYNLTYDESTNTALVAFSRAVTERNLPQQSGVPAAGTYRFKLDQSLLRARLVDSRLDGNGDGRATTGDNYSADNFVGDAGDKITPGVVNITNNGVIVHRVDFYGPADLNVALDNNQTPDGLADANTVFTVHGIMGDHPDHDTNYFRFGGDTDVYKINLQAGQILHLGKMTGAAQLATLQLADENGNPAGSNVAVSLPINQTDGSAPASVAEQAYLIKNTGTYYIVVTNAGDIATNTVPNPNVTAGTIGDYAFTVEIFDDADSGFNAPTDAGNGTAIVTAPVSSVFAGADGALGTADDLARFSTGGFTFTYNAADGSVNGTNASGTITSRRAADGTLTSSVDSAIGTPGHSGLPDDRFSDVDIYHLNGQRRIAAGTRIRITVKLADLGADLGSRSQVGQIDRASRLVPPDDLRGAVQFGLFDSTNATAVDDGLLLFSPTEFSPNGGKPGTLVDNRNAKYGYDSNGDFFIEFLSPTEVGGTAGAILSVYLQGVNNTDYQLEVVTLPDGATFLERRVQNILIETQGGSIDWLEVAAQTTNLSGFNASILGFNGAATNGQSQQDYIISRVVSTLQSMYNSAGIAVNVSANPADFEREDFSTVYLTNASDPVSLLFSFGGNFSTQPYGYSQRSDPFNSNPSDEAVVFVPTFAILGYTPSQTDLDLFTQSLSSAVGRRVGELLGLRVTADDAQGDGMDIQSANGVGFTPGDGNNYIVSRASRPLSEWLDSVERTDFFLGRQDAGSLLDQVLLAR